PPQRAFQLLGAGYDLLTELSDPDPFPSLNRRLRRKGPVLIRRNLLWGGAEASMLLAHTMSSLYIEMDGGLGDPAGGEASSVPSDDGGTPLSGAEHEQARTIL